MWYLFLTGRYTMNIWSTLVVGLSFGLWGMLGSKVGGGAWTAPITMLTTTITAYFFGRSEMAENIPPATTLFWLAMGGLVNGWACNKFAATLVAMGNKAGLYGAVVSICIALSALIWGYFLFGYVPTIKQVSGVLVGVFAIWLVTSG